MRYWINSGCFFQFIYLCCSSNEVFKAVLNACKFEQSCSTINTMSSESSLKDLSCCRPCSCDKYCHERNLCCPDFNESSEYITASNYTQICLPAASNADSSLRYTQYYFVRATCPADFEGDDLKEECERNHDRSVDDAIFVTSQDGHVTYKNKHCAMCHGETNVQIWGVATFRPCISRFLMDITSTKDLNANIMSGCDLLFTPPSVFNEISTYCQGQDQMVSTCPQNPEEQNRLHTDLCTSINGK